jgi:hypothetical protein
MVVGLNGIVTVVRFNGVVMVVNSDCCWMQWNSDFKGKFEENATELSLVRVCGKSFGGQTERSVHSSARHNCDNHLSL